MFAGPGRRSERELRRARGRPAAGGARARGRAGDARRPRGGIAGRPARAAGGWTLSSPGRRSLPVRPAPGRHAAWLRAALAGGRRDSCAAPTPAPPPPAGRHGRPRRVLTGVVAPDAATATAGPRGDHGGLAGRQPGPRRLSSSLPPRASVVPARAVRRRSGMTAARRSGRGPRRAGAAAKRRTRPRTSRTCRSSRGRARPLGRRAA